jgi:transcriptional regulator with GAF, ATPase, and Fis domain
MAQRRDGQDSGTKSPADDADARRDRPQLVRRASGFRQRVANGALDLGVPDPAMDRLQHLVSLVARGDINVLLFGETGVGKELVAHAIHDGSPRAGHPIVPVNCAALPEGLFESELFGYERGAFTGATASKVGLLEAADGGTVFLDEVGEMPAGAQAKLLRALELREIRRIGATRPTPIDVRFVAATHRDLERAIAEGRFRQDLFYRLNGVSLVVPPLRERPAAVRVLALRFLREACATLGRQVPAIGAEALELLEAHPWPGNVRELRNVMERTALLCVGDTVEPEHVLLHRAPPPPSSLAAEAEDALPPPSSEAPPRQDTLGREIEELERRRILEALEACGGNQTLAAKQLGISRRRVLQRLDGYGVPRPRKRR